MYAVVMGRLTARKNAYRGGKGKGKGGKGGGKGNKGDKGGGKGPTSKDGRPICVNCNKIGHDQTKCPEPRVDAKDRKCLRCDKTGHIASQCTSGLPLKAVRVEEAEECATFTITTDWTPVKKGSKHPHFKNDEVNFAHETAFQWNSDSSEDEDGECDASDVGDECADHGGPCCGPCCGLECNARALPCTLAMFREMENGFW